MDAFVSDVAKRFASAAIQVCCSLVSLEDDLKDLKGKFKQIQANLHDAENGSDKESLDEVENLLDEANTEDMIQRMHVEMGRNYRLRTFFTSHNPLMVRFKIARKIKNIREKLDNFQFTPTDITEDAAGIGSEISDRDMPLVEICGRDEEKKMIVDKICNHDDDGVPRVYAIWGMGGVGKTTLAQLVYNDETVKTHFQLKCRVYVSSVFDVKGIIKQIIKSICGLEDKKLDGMSLDDLERQLLKTLEGKKYFIIMDDVWIEDRVEEVRNWKYYLYQKLTCGAKGSTVMVTTRNEITARLMTKNIPEMQHEVAGLSEDESWSLFKMLAFSGRGVAENVSPELQGVAKEIVKKCKGLPLAVNALGITMLGKKREVNEWQLVNKNFMWEMQDKRVLPALRISYDNLLPHWKRCFAYCCLFSKGEEMSKVLMIELWMANEFIPPQGNLSLYEHGEKIFDTLVGRSFFQDVVEKDIDTGVICKMHDLMHNLALDVMGDDCAVIGPGKELGPRKVLHLSLSCEDYEFSEQDLKKLRSLRSRFVSYGDYESNISQISSHVYLRVLYLTRIKSSTLPESICKLIHLRYLKISDSKIEVLPESIIYLQNLQTLILKRCFQLRELPKGLRYMRNLQRLDTGDVNNLQHMPVGIKKLTNLRRLSKFVVGKDEGALIGELGDLILLGRNLWLSGLKNVGGVGDAESAKLKDKTNLKSLTLEWTWDNNRLETFDSEVVEVLETFDSEVVEVLEPNSGLQELEIYDYMGRANSLIWMDKLVNLTSIKFSYLAKCEHLPPLGKLPRLKRIYLFNMGSLKGFHNDDNATSNDLFPSLQELEISFCGSLVSVANNFPKLQSLNISYCGKLCSLPGEIQSFKDLNQIRIWECEILSRRYEKETGEDWHKISDILHLYIQTPRRFDDEDSDENEDTDDDSVNYRHEDSDKNEKKDDDSVNYRDENEDKDDDSVNYRDED